ncbi:MAG: zf-HC2 domain-containing protein [Gemmatimonadaceae bacterium]
MLDCQAVMREIWAYLDGELTTTRLAEIEAHIAMCERCYPQYRFEQTFLGQIARVRREHSDFGGLRTRLVAALTAEGFAAP